MVGEICRPIQGMAAAAAAAVDPRTPRHLRPWEVAAAGTVIPNPATVVQGVMEEATAAGEGPEEGTVEVKAALTGVTEGTRPLSP